MPDWFHRTAGFAEGEGVMAVGVERWDDFPDAGATSVVGVVEDGDVASTGEPSVSRTALQSIIASSRSRLASFCGVLAEIRSRISSISSFGVLWPLVSNFGMADCSARRNSSRPGWK